MIKRIEENIIKMSSPSYWSPIARTFYVLFTMLCAIIIIDIEAGLLKIDMHNIVYKASAQSNGQKEINMTIPEHVWKIMDEEFGLTLEQRIDALTMLRVCENRSYNPEARNTNRHKDGRISTDYGLWQINDHYHIDTDKITLGCTLDVYCSTRYAMKLFINSGYRWTQWTCGRK